VAWRRPGEAALAATRWLLSLPSLLLLVVPALVLARAALTVALLRAARGLRRVLMALGSVRMVSP
jgi:hypothetical protein